MAQMQELMGAAMAHHASAAIATAAAAAGGYPSLTSAAIIPPRTDINAISRACATALGIINSVGGAVGGVGAVIPNSAATAPFPSSVGAGAGLTPSQVPQRETTPRLPQTAQPFPAGVTTSATPMGAGILPMPLPMLGTMGLTAHPQLQVPGNINMNAPATIVEALLRGPGSSAEARAASLPLPQMVPVSDGAPTAPTAPVAQPTLSFAIDARAMNAQFPGLPLPMQLQLAAAAAAARNLPQLQHLRQQQQQIATLASKPAR